jgi:hypothetical protein
VTRRAFAVIDIVEILMHWHAGRKKALVASRAKEAGAYSRARNSEVLRRNTNVDRGWNGNSLSGLIQDGAVGTRRQWRSNSLDTVRRRRRPRTAGRIVRIDAYTPGRLANRKRERLKAQLPSHVGLDLIVAEPYLEGGDAATQPNHVPGGVGDDDSSLHR